MHSLFQKTFADLLGPAVIVMAWASTIALIVGTALAISVKRHAFPYKATLQAILASPLIVPGFFGGWLFASIMSFNEFTASMFITAQATQTLPVAMYNYVREFTAPTLAVLSVIYIATTSAILILANMFLGLGKVLNVEGDREKGMMRHEGIPRA
ncbi:ABC transporter permease [Noviherbaspirillum cavernae]|uniref:ABC transporter permease n=1 Tax=Noviherbaspirillum cavernae TaxID=2320862 RepID=UPI0018F6022C|nr:hypothetical protein [Noviherbaspirillum cavernae]